MLKVNLSAHLSKAHHVWSEFVTVLTGWKKNAFLKVSAHVWINPGEDLQKHNQKNKKTGSRCRLESEIECSACFDLLFSALNLIFWTRRKLIHWLGRVILITDCFLSLCRLYPNIYLDSTQGWQHTVILSHTGSLLNTAFVLLSLNHFTDERLIWKWAFGPKATSYINIEPLKQKLRTLVVILLIIFVIQ